VIVGKKDLRQQAIKAAADLQVQVASALHAIGAISARHQRVELAASVRIGARDAVAREAWQHSIRVTATGVRVATSVIGTPQLDAGTGHEPLPSRRYLYLKLERLHAVGRRLPSPQACVRVADALKRVEGPSDQSWRRGSPVGSRNADSGHFTGSSQNTVRSFGVGLFHG
jgi:hypothetical protein